MTENNPALRAQTDRRIHARAVASWHYIMESNARSMALVAVMIAVAWIGILRIAYLSVHPEHFVIPETNTF